MTHAAPRLFSALLLLTAFSVPATAAPAPKKPARKPAAKAAPAAVRLEIAPAAFTLEGARAVEHLLVTATYADGTTGDVTEQATLSLANPALVALSRGIAQPRKDGTTRVVARLGRIASPPAEIVVRNSGTAAATQFVNDVMPILAKTGCNSSACHGSPAGKGGMKLSLFGYEPDLDHVALTKAADGKRVDLKNPAKSLLLQKATGTVPHGGGKRIATGSREYGTLLAWLREGAPGLGQVEARVRKVEVFPGQPWLPSPGTRQRLVVHATLSDGSVQDVTDRALFDCDDESVADVDEAGTVAAKKPGEAAVMVRYLGQVAVSRVAVLPPWKIDRYPAIAAQNAVDPPVLAKLQKLRVVPSDRCTDEEFIRRATLDVCGVIPTPEEVKEFLADGSADKRGKLVEKLLARPEFVDLWTMKWSDTLRDSPRVLKYSYQEYGDWIRAQVAANRPFDEFARDLVTASGRAINSSSMVGAAAGKKQQKLAKRLEQIESLPFNGATNFFLISQDPLDIASATSQIFMGVRIECARCHNHPFEKWTQNDYYAFASYFSGLGGKGGKGKNAGAVMPNPRAKPLLLPKTEQPVEPRTLDDVEAPVAPGSDARVALATWMTRPDNPYFARAIANRIWGHYFGRGIVDPIDDFRLTNPACNPELLDVLAKEVVDHRFDLKALHRLILNSRTYQTSSHPNATNRDDVRNFARFVPKRLMAEALFDSISQATGVSLSDGTGRRGGKRPGKQSAQKAAARQARLQQLAGAGGAQAAAQQARIQRLGGGTDTERVMQLPLLTGAKKGGGNGPIQFLETFGKPRRDSVCECERSPDGNMSQALALMSGDEVNEKIAAPDGRVQQLIRSGKPVPEMVDELYLAVLSRRPTPPQRERALQMITSADTHGEGIEDLAWSLLNSREFLFNH